MSIASPPSYASGCLPIPACAAADLVQHLLEAIERPVEIAPCNDKGRRKSDHGAVCLLREPSLGQESLADLARARDPRVDLGADPQSAPAHLVEREVIQCPQPREHMRAKSGAAIDQLLVADDAQCFEPNRGGERIAAEGRAVRAGGEDVHHLASSNKGGDRQHAAAERLTENDSIGTKALVLIGKPRAGAAEPGLHLVEDEEDAVRIAAPAQAREKAMGRHDDARLAL